MIMDLLSVNPYKKGQWGIAGICNAFIVLSIPGLIGAGILTLGISVYKMIFEVILPENWMSISFCIGFGIGEFLIVMFFAWLDMQC
jgi:hypothetical protein